MEPTSVVAKAWEQVERIGARGAAWRPRVALITGAGPVGLLAALLAELSRAAPREVLVPADWDEREPAVAALPRAAEVLAAIETRVLASKEQGRC